MRKTTKLLTTLALCMMFVGASTVVASADTVIKAGKEYKINLDGESKKETVYIDEIETEDDTRYNYNLYINDKLVNSIEGVFGVKCKVLDIQKSKKGKEIYITGTENSACHIDTFGIYKYNKGKLIKIADSKYSSYQFVRVPKSVTTNGKGKVYLTVDTPIELGNGCYYGTIVLQMKNGKLCLVNKKQISMDKYSSKYKYVANKKIKLYKKASNKSKVLTTVKRGDKLTISKVKFNNVKTTKYNKVAKSAYAYVVDKDGNKGWIKLDDNQFRNYPAWG